MELSVYNQSIAFHSRCNLSAYPVYFRWRRCDRLPNARWVLPPRSLTGADGRAKYIFCCQTEYLSTYYQSIDIIACPWTTASLLSAPLYLIDNRQQNYQNALMICYRYRQQLPSAVVPIFSCRMIPVRFRFDQDILVRSASLSGPLSINIFRYHRHQRRRNTFTCSGINLTEKTFVTRPFIVNTLGLVQVTERLVCGRHRTMMDFATSFSSGAWQRPFNVSPIWCTMHNARRTRMLVFLIGSLPEVVTTSADYFHSNLTDHRHSISIGNGSK